MLDSKVRRRSVHDADGQMKKAAVWLADACTLWTEFQDMD